jgi:hypothetical protein
VIALLVGTRRSGVKVLPASAMLGRGDWGAETIQARRNLFILFLL